MGGKNGSSKPARSIYFIQYSLASLLLVSNDDAKKEEEVE